MIEKAIYSVAVARDFIARHFLFGGDWGSENSPHAHHYKIELVLQGAELDQHGYLVDIVEIEAAMNDVSAHFRDTLLNDLVEFTGLNPSIEHLSRICWEMIAARISAPNIGSMTVKVWENEIAWASYHRDRG
jgi:6-pyruvoyltetrahydropterin/6-carboxytetrahydropterin synthase